MGFRTEGIKINETNFGKTSAFSKVAEVHLVASGRQAHNEWSIEWYRPKSTFNGADFFGSCSAAFNTVNVAAVFNF